MKKYSQVACLLLVALWVVPVQAADELPAVSAHALAPEGRWVARAELRSNSYDQRFDSNGDLVGLGAVFDGVDLNADFFPALSAMGAGASLGTTALNSDVSVERVELTFGYGVTEALTFGAIFNFGHTNNQVDFSVAGGSVGWNPLFDATQAIGASNFPFAPVGASALAPMATSDINQILTNPAFGYEYAPLANTKTSGAGEAILGLLWQFYKKDTASLVWGLGLRKGLGEADDPDNLFDVPLDDGSDDLLSQVEYFRNWQQVDLRAMVKRTIQSSDEVTMRVPAAGEVLALAASKEVLQRDLGDFWEYDLELGYVWHDWRYSATWHRWQKSADSYRSSLGSNTEALQTNTNIDANQWRLAISWSGINAWQAGDMPLPLVLKLEVQETYEGRNMVDVRDVYFIATTFF